MSRESFPTDLYARVPPTTGPSPLFSAYLAAPASVATRPLDPRAGSICSSSGGSSSDSSSSAPESGAEQQPDGGIGDLSPLHWSRYFNEQLTVHLPPIPPAKPDTPQDRFCVYLASPPDAPSPPPFVALLLHGGGHSSLTWACVASYLKQSMSVVAVDLRGHGHTRTSDDSALSMPQLVSDLVLVLRTLYAPSIPPLLLVGHSLSGALAVHLASCRLLPACGLVVVDLVEGTAVESLGHMRAVVESRPSRFRSAEEAVRWALVSGVLRNRESARVSVPDQLVRVEAGEEGSEQPQQTDQTTDSDSTSASPSPPTTGPFYRWRTDLLATEPHWRGWFTGLSQLFLSVSLPKLLLLCSTDRLDTTLMVAHMQGKLQLEVVPGAGHSLQEDSPRDTARKIVEFVQRQRLVSMAAVWRRQQQQVERANRAMQEAAAKAESGGQQAAGASSTQAAEAASPATAIASASSSHATNARERPPVSPFH